MVDVENKKQVGTMHYLSASSISIFPTNAKYSTSENIPPNIRPKTIKYASSNVSMTEVNKSYIHPFM